MFGNYFCKLCIIQYLLFKKLASVEVNKYFAVTKFSSQSLFFSDNTGFLIRDTRTPKGTRSTVSLFVRSYESGTLRLSNHTKAEHLFLVLLASLLSGWTTTTGRLLGPNGDKRKVSFPRTQRRIARTRIEPGVSNQFSITSPTLHHWATAATILSVRPGSAWMLNNWIIPLFDFNTVLSSKCPNLGVITPKGTRGLFVL